MITWMTPKPRVTLRAGIFAVLMVLLAISPGPIPRKSIGVIMFAFLTGSYRRSYIDVDVLHTQLVLCFIPLKHKRFRLKRFHQIEIALEEPAGWWTFFLLGPVQWLWSRIFDFIIPWFTGIYQIWISSPKKRVLVWQGFQDADYEHNLEALTSITGLEVIRARDL